MPTADVVTYAGEHHSRPDTALVQCALFGDRVAERVCFILKEELNAWWSGDVFCRGCCRRWLGGVERSAWDRGVRS